MHEILKCSSCNDILISTENYLQYEYENFIKIYYDEDQNVNIKIEPFKENKENIIIKTRRIFSYIDYIDSYDLKIKRYCYKCTFELNIFNYKTKNIIIKICNKKFILIRNIEINNIKNINK